MYGANAWQMKIACIGIALAHRGRELWPIGAEDTKAFGFDDVVRRMYARAMAWEAYERCTAARGVSVPFLELPVHGFVVRGAVLCPLRKARLCHVSEDGLVHTLRYAMPPALAGAHWFANRTNPIAAVRTCTGEMFRIAFVGSVHLVLVANALCEGVKGYRRLDLETALVVYPHLATADMELELAVSDPLCGPSLLELREDVLELWRKTLAERIVCGVCFETVNGMPPTRCCA